MKPSAQLVESTPHSHVDTIPDITHLAIDPSKVNERAFYIWKQYGNPDSVGLHEVVDLKECELLSCRKRTANGNETGRNLSSSRWRVARRVLLSSTPRLRRLHRSGMDDLVPARSVQLLWRDEWYHHQLVSVSPIHGERTQRTWYPHDLAKGGFIPHLQLFNYVVEGFIVFTGFDARIQDELQNCFVSMPSYKVFTVSISDCLYLAEVVSTVFRKQ